MGASTYQDPGNLHFPEAKYNIFNSLNYKNAGLLFPPGKTSEG